MLCEAEGLGVVCDGMGGHHGGEIASRLAADLFADRITRLWPVLSEPGRKLSKRRALAKQAVQEGAAEANAAIHQRGGSESGDGSTKSRMGTTLAVVLVVGDFAVVANVGDSRVYRMRDGIIEQLSEDHTILAHRPGARATDRKRKFVTRALGTKSQVEVSVRMVDVYPGDLFVLCSDGLTDVVADEEISKVVHHGRFELRRAVRRLVRLANERGGPDNITVVVAEVIGDDDDDTEALQTPR